MLRRLAHLFAVVKAALGARARDWADWAGVADGVARMPVLGVATRAEGVWSASAMEPIRSPPPAGAIETWMAASSPCHQRRVSSD
jgi:hypothetical protein